MKRKEKYMHYVSDKRELTAKILRGKKAEQYMRAYLTSKKYDLTDCYKYNSHAKDVAEMYVIQRMQDLNGYGYKIISYNTNCFTCGYYIEDATCDWLIIETAWNIYAIEEPKLEPLDEMEIEDLSKYYND